MAVAVVSHLEMMTVVNGSDNNKGKKANKMHAKGIEGNLNETSFLKRYGFRG